MLAGPFAKRLESNAIDPIHWPTMKMRNGHNDHSIFFDTIVQAVRKSVYQATAYARAKNWPAVGMLRDIEYGCFKLI